MIKEVLQLEFELLYNKTRVFSFEAGAVVNPDCILYYEAEKAFYQWNGTYDVNNEYVVNAGSTPETAGGIGGNAWTRSTGSGFMSTVLVSDTEPTAPFQNMLWWDTRVSIPPEHVLEWSCGFCITDKYSGHKTRTSGACPRITTNPACRIDSCNSRRD